MISYILLECSPGSEEEVISELNSIVGVVEVNGVLGKYDVFVENDFQISNTLFCNNFLIAFLHFTNVLTYQSLRNSGIRILVRYPTMI